MLRTLPRLPAAMLAAALSGLLLMLVGTAAPASARGHAASASDVGTSSDRAAAGLAKATLHKADVGARTHHDQSGLGPDLVALPPADLDRGTFLNGSSTVGADDSLHGALAAAPRSRAPPR